MFTLIERVGRRFFEQLGGSCSKVQYETESEALLFLDRIQRMKTAKRRECGVYFCEQCQAWHLTSQK